MDKKSLFDITDEMLRLDQLLSDFDGEITDEEKEKEIDLIFERMTQNKEEFKEKVEAYIYLIKTMRGRASVRKQESDRLALIVKQDEANADRLVNRLVNIMDTLEMSKIQTNLHQIGVQNAGGVLPIVYAENFDFKEHQGEIATTFIKKVPTLDTGKVREVLEGNDEQLKEKIWFAKIGKRKRILRIK